VLRLRRWSAAWQVGEGCDLRKRLRERSCLLGAGTPRRGRTPPTGVFVPSSAGVPTDGRPFEPGFPRCSCARFFACYYCLFSFPRSRPDPMGPRPRVHRGLPVVIRRAAQFLYVSAALCDTPHSLPVRVRRCSARPVPLGLFSFLKKITSLPLLETRRCGLAPPSRRCEERRSADRASRPKRGRAGFVPCDCASSETRCL